MGLLDSLVTSAVTSALGVNSEGMAGNVVKGVVGMLTGGSGAGLTDIVGKLTQSGLGDVVSSWIGKGANKAISASQLVEALGQDQVNAMAKEAGIPEDKGAEVLSKVLPEVVNEITPDGEIPDEGKMGTLTKVILGGLGVAGATMAAKAVAGRFRNNDEEDESELVTADAGVAAAPQYAPAPQAQTYTVAGGDSLSKIAKHFYGNANDWQKIFDANRDQISNPDLIQPGQVLRIP